MFGRHGPGAAAVHDIGAFEAEMHLDCAVLSTSPPRISSNLGEA